MNAISAIAYSQHERDFGNRVQHGNIGRQRTDHHRDAKPQNRSDRAIEPLCQRVR